MFKQLGLSESISDKLELEGITKPTEVQRHCIPLILNQKDVIACAKTGSGKTAAYILPIIELLMKKTTLGFCVILAPTRELANQIFHVTQSMIAGTNITSTLIIGQSRYTDQIQAIKSGVNIIIATPGRLADIFRKNKETNEFSFNFSKFLIMDEADHLLEYGFNNDLQEIFETLPKKIRKLLFTATLNPQILEYINFISEKIVANGREAPVIYKDESLENDNLLTVNTLRQYYLESNNKFTLILVVIDKIIEDLGDSSIMLFTNERRTCFVIYNLLKHFQYSCAMLHAALDQQQRDCAMKRFQSGAKQILVCTDLACRGLDFPNVDFVINYNMPQLPATYVHRVGRTARSGRLGTAITFVTPIEHDDFLDILDHIGTDMESYPLNKYDNNFVIERHTEVTKVITDIVSTLKRAEAFKKQKTKENKEKKKLDNKEKSKLDNKNDDVVRKRKKTYSKNKKSNKKQKIESNYI